MVPAISRTTVERGAYVFNIITIYIPRDRLRRGSLLHGDGAFVVPKVPGQLPVQPAMTLDVTTIQPTSNRRESRVRCRGRKAVRTPKKNV